MDVLDVGCVPTPLLYFATHTLDTGTGIMITGSHNPPEYNGLKMMVAGETLADLDDADENFGIAVSEEVTPADMGLKLDPQIFRAYDIRGIVDKNLTEDVVYWIGRAFAAEALEL